MATKKLRRAGLSQELCDRLSRHQITTCRDFLCLSLLELMKVTGQSYQNVQKLLCKVSLACAPKMQTAYEMKMKRAINPSSAFLSTTLHGLDKALHGGVACGSLTEVTGPPGCGKTQFCLMMSVLATLPISMGGLHGAVIYIDTESAFGAERLVEIAGHRFPNYFVTEEKLFSMTRNIHLYPELTCDCVLKRIETLEEEIISKKVKLVIIDSIASVVRKEFDMKLQGNLLERSNFLARGASLLKYLAEEFSIPSGLGDPVVDVPEQEPEQSGDRDMVPEEEDSEETGTLTLEPVTQTPEASQVLSDAGDEAAAGPAVQEGRSTPASPPSWGHGSRRHRRVYADILRQHVAAVQDLNTILRERVEAEAWWHDWLMEELVQQRTSLCASLREVCGLPAPVLGPALPAPHDHAPPNPPSHSTIPSPPCTSLSPSPPSSPAPLSPWPSSPPGLPVPRAPPLCCPANGQSPHPIPWPWWTPNKRPKQGTASRQAPYNLIPFPPPGFKSPSPLQVSSPLSPSRFQALPSPQLNNKDCVKENVYCT
ncbi:DNA repair protein RAD51 homolog 2 isoform X3 [Pelodiscus sinensis]